MNRFIYLLGSIFYGTFREQGPKRHDGGNQCDASGGCYAGAADYFYGDSPDDDPRGGYRSVQYSMQGVAAAGRTYNGADRR